MRTGQPREALELSAEERGRLEAWARRPKTAQRLALRARIVLASAEGLSNLEAARRLRIHPVTVGKWRERFRLHRLEGLSDEPRAGAPRTISDAKVEEAVAKTLETLPEGATHWSTRLMARETGLTQNAIVRIWRAFGLQPHRSETFKLSTDPFFVDKVRDIVGLYLNPPDRAVVLCVDEKSQVQALDRTQPLLPMRPGQAERRTHDYVRHGTTSLFAALDVATGKVMGSCHGRHRQQEFLRFLERVDTEFAEDAEIHLVLDNSSIHKTPRVKRWFARRPRYRLHFTPTSASWLNQVERFFAEITRKRIRRGAFSNVQALKTAIRDYLDHHNRDPKPFVWTADADLILSKVQRICERTYRSGH